MNKKLYKEILNKLKKIGFDLNKLIYPIQLDN